MGVITVKIKHSDVYKALRTVFGLSIHDYCFFPSFFSRKSIDEGSSHLYGPEYLMLRILRTLNS